MKECPGQYLQNKFQDQKRCGLASYPGMKSFLLKRQSINQGPYYEKLNAVVSTRILYSKFHHIFKSWAVTLYRLTTICNPITINPYIDSNSKIEEN